MIQTNVEDADSPDFLSLLSFSGKTKRTQQRGKEAKGKAKPAKSNALADV